MQQIDKEIEYMNVAKAIGIILIVVGHSFAEESTSSIRSFVYLFHVPLFFILSGYFFDDKYIDKALPNEIDTEYKRWKDPNGKVFTNKDDYDNAVKFGHKLELNTQITGSKHLSTKNITDADKENLQSVMKKLNIDTLDFDNQDSIRSLQKALGMKASDITAGKFGQKTLLAIKKYLNK